MGLGKWCCRRSCRLGCAVGALAGTLLAGEARGELLVYEGFRATAEAGDGGYGSSLVGVNPNQYTIGLNKTVNYAGATISTYTVNSTSLAFSPSFPTLAGSLVTTGTAAGIAAGPLSLSGPHVGTLYHSYLVNFAAHSSGSGEGTHTRVASNDSTSNVRFSAEADARAGTVTTLQGVSYNSGTVVTGGTTLDTNTTFLIIARWTNVGGTLSASTPGVGTLYALTANQFNSFVAAGSTENYLDTAPVGSNTNSITTRLVGTNTASGGNNAFGTGFVQFVTVGHVLGLDEMRYGSSLADVVPEPAGLGVAVVGMAGLLHRRRRRTARSFSAG